MASVARFTTLSVALAMLTVGAGCGSRDEAVGPAAAGSTAAPEGTVADTEAPSAGAVPQGMVRVRGMVRLAEGSELPGYTDEEIGRTADRPEVPEGCSPARASDTRPMRLSEQRGVGGILVTATGNLEHFRQLPAVAPRTIPLGIRDCRLEPTLIVAAVGDVIDLTNHSPRAFLTSFTTDPINEAQATGRSRQLEVIRPGVQRVECTIAAGCGRTEVVVLAHRVAVVTDREGRFELDVPAGAEVTLHAWHPLMRRREGEARLTIDQAVAGETRTLDIPLSLTPVPENPPVPQSPPLPGVQLE
jgi:hypothetical protein